MMIKVIEFLKYWLVFSQDAPTANGVVYGGRLMLWTLMITLVCSFSMGSERVLLSVVISQVLAYLYFVLNALLVSDKS
jgi:hypothetical protein